MPKRLNYRSPADDSGNFREWLNALKNQSGVYVIRNRASGEILYVGESHTGQLAKTIKRHFWPHKDRTNPTRHDAYQRGRVEIAIRLCPPPAAIGCQNALIDRLNPRDNVFGFKPDPDPF